MNKLAHYHFIGIGGIGMSALAKILLDNKVTVSGSDVSDSNLLKSLKACGASTYIGHDQSHIKEGSFVVYNSMINKKNPEFQRALDLKCTMLHRSELINQIAENFKVLAVSGTHGKTTTSSLLATVLKKAGFDPAFALGGLLSEDNVNGRYGTGSYFVVEADESDGSFLNYPVFGSIVTNIDNDHLDHYKSLDNIKEAFRVFFENIQDERFLFWCSDDSNLLSLNPKGFKYGFKDGADLKGSNLRRKGFKSFFDVEFQGKKYVDVEINLPGVHQALNALAVFGLAMILGADENSIRDTFKSFKGISRRLEVHCNTNHVLVLDDYAHHPTEIKTTLEGLRKAVGARRVIAVFQPHRYSRTKDCLNDLGSVFDFADEVIVTDLYSAFEEPISSIDAKAVLNKIQQSSTVKCHYIAKDELKNHLIEIIRPHDVLVTLNAGDLCKISFEVGQYFTYNRPKKLKAMLMYGGKSTEHGVSIKSAQFIRASLNQDIYDLDELYVAQAGFNFNEEILSKILKADFIFPCFHGPFGEDGTIQGFFDILNKAYVGCSHAASSVAMDKVLTKRIAIACGIKTAKFYSSSIYKWQDNKEAVLKEVQDTLKLPIFVKPSHLGSSIGLSKVDSYEALCTAIDYAFTFDTDVLIEEGIKGREIEFSVLGNFNAFIADPAEIITDGKVYDFDAKYGNQCMSAKVPCLLSQELIEEGKNLTRKIYEAIGGSGLSRIDFFLDENGQYWLNEINPIPGFTEISVYPKAMIHSGYGPNELIDELVILGLQTHRTKDRHLNL